MSSEQIIITAATERLILAEKNTVIVEELQERVDIIQHKLKFLEKKPAVLCISSLEPISTAGGIIEDIVSVAGGLAVLSDQTAIDWDNIRHASPDIIILMLQNQTMEKSMSSINLLLEQPGFNELSAVKNNRFYIADGSKYFYESGPSVIDSLEILAEIINPKQFIFGYEGSGWVKFEV